jgi:hypothetical protein
MLGGKFEDLIRSQRNFELGSALRGGIRLGCGIRGGIGLGEQKCSECLFVHDAKTNRASPSP